MRLSFRSIYNTYEVYTIHYTSSGKSSGKLKSRLWLASRCKTLLLLVNVRLSYAMLGLLKKIYAENKDPY